MDINEGGSLQTDNCGKNDLDNFKTSYKKNMPAETKGINIIECIALFIEYLIFRR